MDVLVSAHAARQLARRQIPPSTAEAIAARPEQAIDLRPGRQVRHGMVPMRPSPRQVGQASSMIWPWPLQRGQGLTLTIWPSIVERTLRTSPLPLHWGQVIGLVPALAPVPEHVSQRARALNSMSFSAPLIDSAKVRRRS